MTAPQCTKQNRTRNPRAKRTNKQWVYALTGEFGHTAQQEAIEDLGHYLYILAYNRLCGRQNDVAYLSNLPAVELESYAEDFVQETLVKLTEKNYRRIRQYRGEGAFTSWAAQVIINCIRDELRSMAWHRQARPGDQIQYVRDLSAETDPETQAMGNAIRERVNAHVKRLSPKSRTAVTRCLVQGESVSDVAEELGISANALYIQLSRGRESLRNALMNEGLVPGM